MVDEANVQKLLNPNQFLIRTLFLSFHCKDNMGVTDWLCIPSTCWVVQMVGSRSNEQISDLIA